MANISDYNYQNIDSPYDNNLQRVGGDLGSLGNESTVANASTFSTGSTADSGGIETGEEMPSSPEVTSPAQMKPSAIPGSSFSNIWIDSWIKSTNYAPKSRGFYFDGPRGYIECRDLFSNNAVITGTITATSGAIGGWIISANTISSTGVVLSSVGDAYIAFGTTPPTSPTSGTGIFINKTGLFGLNGGTQNFKISAADGSITSILGTIGGWGITSTVLRSGTTDSNSNILLDPANSLVRVGPTTGNYISIDGAGLRIRSSNYASGVAGSGFNLDSNFLEVGNIACRGIIRTAVFQKDIVSAIAGNQVVTPNSDVLDVDMTALDSSTLTIKGTATFSVGDLLQMKDGVDSEWLEIANASLAPIYSVTRDKKGDYASNNNPAWKKGATVVNFGQSGQGGVYITASEFNAPYISVFTHAGTPWSGLTQRARLGNLSGLNNPDTGAALSGYGLWTDNIYLTGVIVANSGRIGGSSGWQIGTGYITSVNGGNTTTLSSGGTYALIAGPTGSPTASISHAGVLAATGADITGTITANTGYIGGIASGWTITTGKIYGGSGSAFSGLIQGTGTTKAFFAGATDNSGTNAEFYVTAAGDLVANSATIAGYKLFEAVVADDGTGDYPTVSAALAAGKTRIFVRNGTYINESRWNLSTDKTVITGESKNGVSITFASNNGSNPGSEKCIYITKGVSLSSMNLISYDFSSTTVKMFDKFPSIISTYKWAETDPSSLIGPYGAFVDGVQFVIPHSGTIAMFNTNLKSIETVTSGTAVFQSNFQWTSGGANEAIIGIGLYIDNNNYAFFESRATGGNLVRLVIVKGGVNVYDYTTAHAPYDGTWKVTYDLSTKDIKFYINQGSSWAQVGTTQNQNLGSTVYAVLTFADSAAYADADTLIVEYVSLTSADYSTYYPFIQQDLISIDTTSYQSILKNLSLKNTRGKAISNSGKNFCIADDIYFDYSSATDPSYSRAFSSPSSWNITNCFIDARTLPASSSNITFMSGMGDCLLSNIRITNETANVIWRLGSSSNSNFSNSYFKCQEMSIKTECDNCHFINNGNAPSGYFISIDDIEVTLRNCHINLANSYDILKIGYAGDTVTNCYIHGGKKILLDSDTSGIKSMQFIANNWVSSYTAAAIDLEVSSNIKDAIITNNTLRNNAGGGSTPTITDSGSSTTVANNELIH